MELLLTLALSSLLGAVMVSAYTGSRQHYFYQEQVARLQENGRHALRLIARELSMASFYGGVAGLTIGAPGRAAGDCGAAPWALQTSPAIDLVNDATVGGLPLSVHGHAYSCIDEDAVRDGSDLLAIRRSAGRASVLRGVADPALTASTVRGWYIRSGAGQPPAWEQWRPVNLRRYGSVPADVTLYKAVARVFFLRQRNDDEPELCMETLAGERMTLRCLVSGIEDLQLEFGIDSDGDGVANRYIDNPGPHELAHAVSVQLHLLARSHQPVAGHRVRQRFALGRKLVEPPLDGRLRRTFTATVGLGTGPRRLG